MKSIKVDVMITEEMVEHYEKIFGKQTSLPPSFPMLFYQFIKVPWKYEEAPIHRKQKCFLQKELIVNKIYQCTVTLDRHIQKEKNVFYTQSLVGVDDLEEECFRCVSELVVQLP